MMTVSIEGTPDNPFLTISHDKWELSVPMADAVALERDLRDCLDYLAQEQQQLDEQAQELDARYGEEA